MNSSPPFRLAIADPKTVSLDGHSQQQAIIAELRDAWVRRADGAIARAETRLAKINPALYGEYISFISANPKASETIKAEVWCRQELEGPLDGDVSSPSGDRVDEVDQPSQTDTSNAQLDAQLCAILDGDMRALEFYAHRIASAYEWQFEKSLRRCLNTFKQP